ncbi:Clp protease N-terminal domain-containing protein [Pseudoduganella sp. LjRoot289]|uniref:Clp protease N-terminal domain-containing protein n=1 Tax=Pseudoduganella sp. LjRoot289 TaxID=3342314 RepID=UPI003ED15AD0
MFAKLKQRLQDMRTIKNLCEGAESQARQAGQRQPGAEHYVLSALELADGSARRVFQRLGADPDAYRAALASQHVNALGKLGIDASGVPPATPVDGAPAAIFDSQPSGQALMQALPEMTRRLPAPLCGAHVLLAAAAMQHSQAARALRTMKLEPQALAQAAQEELQRT